MIASPNEIEDILPARSALHTQEPVVSRRPNWEQANQRDRDRAQPTPPSKGKQKRHFVMRQNALQAFALKHGLACFACRQTSGDYAKSGSNARGPWIICVPCVEKRQAEQARVAHR